MDANTESAKADRRRIAGDCGTMVGIPQDAVEMINEAEGKRVQSGFVKIQKTSRDRRVFLPKKNTKEVLN